MALDYLTYYLAGFIWGIYFRDFWFSIGALWAFGKFFYYVFGTGTTNFDEFYFWLPLTAIFGLIIGLILPLILNGPYLITFESFSFEWYVVKIIVQIVILHALLILWEVLPVTPFPWGGIVQLVAFSVAIFVIYWLNRSDFIWAVRRKVNSKKCNGVDGEYEWVIGNCPLIIHLHWALFFLPVILIFTLVTAFTYIWPFWIGLFVFIISTIALIIIYFLYSVPYPYEIEETCEC